MSKKRDFVAKLFPAGIPLSKSVNDNAVFVEMRRTRFAACPEFSDRPALYEYISDMISGPIDYLEFGVWQGASIKAWARLNTHPASRFVGFDSFEGLPEDWEDHLRGAFSTKGQQPQIDDARVIFVKGLFQETLRPFLETTAIRNRLIVNVDCDLYSAALFVLGTLDKYFKLGTIVIFDDFYSMGEEFKAFADYNRSFGRAWNAIGRLPYCVKAAIEIKS